MTVNELVWKIAQRAKELADTKLDILRREHPDSQHSDVGYPPEDVRKMSRGQVMEDILTEEFSLDFDQEIEVV